MNIHLSFGAFAQLAIAAALTATTACSGDDSTSPSDASPSDATTSDGAPGAEAATEGGALQDAATGADVGPNDDGGSDATEAGALSFADNVYTPILGVICSGCHGPLADGGGGPGLQFGHLDMRSAAVAYANLIGDGGGAPASGSKCADAGVTRVVPGEPDLSLLYNKVISNIGDGGPVILADGGALIFCGSPMPLHSPALPGADLATIHDWIAQGANP